MNIHDYLKSIGNWKWNYLCSLHYKSSCFDGI